MIIDQMISVLQAAREGKQIERRVKGTKNWIDGTIPSWNFCDIEYRVKPEPREFWICESGNCHCGSLGFVGFHVYTENQKVLGQIHVREVIE